jgi:hypothetical protein
MSMPQVQEESLSRILVCAEYIAEVTLNAEAKIVAWG